MAGVLQHLRSSTANKRPNPASMVDGQVAINYASGSPGMFFKDSAGNLVKVGPVHVGSGAPNASPASGGTTGNSIGEQWLDTSGASYVFKIWDGTAWRSETGTFVDAAGDVMTGALGIIAGTASAPGLYVSGSTSTGLYSPGANSVALATAGTGRLFVASDGKVGLGTSAPIQLLHIAGSSANAIFDGTSNSYTTYNVASSNVGYVGDANWIFGGSSSNFGIRATSNLVFGIGANERARLDASGRLLVGASTSASAGGNAQYARLQIYGNTYDDSYGILNLGRKEAATSITSGEYIGAVSFSDQSGNEFAGVYGIADAAAGSGDYPGRLVFSTTPDGSSSPVERMRIDNSGVVSIGSGNGTLLQFNNSGGYNGFHSLDNTAYTIGQNSDYRSFRIGSGANWLTTGVNLAAGGTSWGTYSDERLKKDISELTGCLEKLSNIRCVTYRLKDVDAEDSKKRIGVIAQDLQGKFSEALNTSKRSEDDSTEYLSVQYTDLVPVLIKALQESKERIETLEARVAALEGA